MDRNRIPGLIPGKRHPDWQIIYEEAKEETLPWHFPQLDPDIRHELESSGTRLKILDIGCGLGHQAAFMAHLGHEVAATDISKTAIARAKRLHKGIRFSVDDVTETTLSGKFDVAVDRGCLHVLEQGLHKKYINSVFSFLNPGGLLLLKVLSTENGSADSGPVHFSQLALHRLFAEKFQILRIQRTIYYGSTSHAPSAWFSVIRKRESHA